MSTADDKPAAGTDPADRCCARAGGSAGYASPPCYAHEFPAYFGAEEDDSSTPGPTSPADATRAPPRRPSQGQSA